MYLSNSLSLSLENEEQNYEGTTWRALFFKFQNIGQVNTLLYYVYVIINLTFSVRGNIITRYIGII